MSDSYTIGGKWLDDLRAELQGSDRACAVLAGAILDDRLKALLAGYLLPPQVEREDRLLGRSGAVESFSARIELAYRLGLVSAATRRSLDWTRDIRNDAAHQPEFGFDIDSVRDRVQNLASLIRLNDIVPEGVRSEFGESAKGRFVLSVMMLAAALQIEAGESGRTKHVCADMLGAKIHWHDGA
jgi:hypothetical protein